MLCRHLAEVDAADQAGFTPLHIAAQYGHYEVVAGLEDHGCDLGLKTLAKGYTGLHSAVARGHTEVVALFIELGAPLAETSHAGETALHLAARKNRVGIIELLGR